MKVRKKKKEKKKERREKMREVANVGKSRSKWVDVSIDTVGWRSHGGWFI